MNKNIELQKSYEWIRSAFYCFREYPVQFIVLSIISVLIGFLPLFNAFMSPLFTARFAALANQVERNNQLKFSELFNDFFANPTLVRLAFLNFILMTLLLLIMKLFTNNEFLLILSLVPIIILALSMWLSPIICLYNPGIPPIQAMKLSLKFTLYNAPVLLIYGLLVLAFTLLAMLPLGLGLIIWVPVLNITSYYIYKDAF